MASAPGGPIDKISREGGAAIYSYLRGGGGSLDLPLTGEEAEGIYAPLYIDMPLNSPLYR